MAYGCIDQRTGVLVEIALQDSLETFSEAYQALLDMQDVYLMNDPNTPLGDVYTGDLKDITILSENDPMTEVWEYEITHMNKVRFEGMPL